MGSTPCNRDEKHTDGAEQTTGHNKNTLHTLIYEPSIWNVLTVFFRVSEIIIIIFLMLRTLHIGGTESE